MITRANWTICYSDADRVAALALCKGEYQRAIIEGREALSGSTLVGRARRSVLTYKASSADLLRRVRAAGIAVSERVGPRGARLLVIGVPTDLDR